MIIVLLTGRQLFYIEELRAMMMMRSSSKFSDEKCTERDDDDTVFIFVDEKCIYILYSAAGTAEGQGDSGRG